MIKLLLALILATSGNTVELKDLSLQWGFILPGSRLLELPQYTGVQTLSLNTEVRFVRHLFFRLKPHMIATESQVRWAGLEGEAGVTTERFDISVFHHSQHCLECVHPYMKRFPETNAVLLTARLQ
jgi:hypothetical protein